MTDKLGDRILCAIESGNLDVDVVPATDVANPEASCLYKMVVKIGADELARVGVWKSSAGGTVGDGIPHVKFDGRTVHVASGDGMDGSFDIDCEFETEAEEIANALDDRLSEEYEEIEAEIASS